MEDTPNESNKEKTRIPSGQDHVENTWKFRPTPRGKHMEIWWKVKQILTWIPCGNTWKTRGIHAEMRWTPRGIDVEITRKYSGSLHVEKTRRTRVIHVDKMQKLGVKEGDTWKRRVEHA